MGWKLKLMFRINDLRIAHEFDRSVFMDCTLYMYESAFSHRIYLSTANCLNYGWKRHLITTVIFAAIAAADRYRTAH